MLIKLADVLGIEIFDFSHEAIIKELREAMNRLLKETDEEKIWLAVKILRAVAR